MSTHHVASVPVPYTYSFRLTFQIQESHVELVGTQRVAMRASASLPGAPGEQQVGFWFELRDEKGAVLYHRALRDPLPEGIEVFDDEKGGKIRRAPNTRKEARFDMIVPDLPAAEDFILHGTHGKPEEARRASRQLARFPLAQLRKLAIEQERQTKPR
ncbi:MAG TPA: hypothetical protein VM689_00075 [Aliidongia sp.]|nr:hypothetical protein [Aliidongia sp.]